VIEDKLYLFLEQEVINRESRALGYQARKAKRREIWEEGERAKKRQKTTEPARKKKEEEEGSEEGSEEGGKEVLNGLFNETVRFSVVNSYVSAIAELYAW
jgi:hypothetical protein